MKTFDVSKFSPPEIHRLLVSGIAPRPIALVATVDGEGRVNLSPFSFFNVFGVNPAVLCFSPAYAGRSGDAKHTMLNLDETKECTVSIVTYEMVQQISLASAPFARGVDEFEKSGLTKRGSAMVAPPGVAESPFIMEARLLQHVGFGGKPGSANMMICEILTIHVAEEVMTPEGGIDPTQMDQVARLGGAYYTRAREGLFTLAQPTKAPAGVDALPEEIRLSSILTGSDLAMLAGVDQVPSPFVPDPETAAMRHLAARGYLEHDDIQGAWRALLGSR